MKNIVKNIIAAAFAVGLVTSVSAAPPGKGPLQVGTYKEASTQEQILSLKKGDHYALVCTDCKSITVKQVGDEKEVAALCHNGGSMHCESCKQKSTIQHTSPPGKGTDTTKVTIVNAEGKQCMFIVPMKS